MDNFIKTLWRQRNLGWLIVIITVAYVTYQTVVIIGLKDDVSCQTKAMAEYREVAISRGTYADSDRQAMRDLLADLVKVKKPADSLKAYDKYRTREDAIDKQREENPLPSLQGKCGTP